MLARVRRREEKAKRDEVSTIHNPAGLINSTLNRLDIHLDVCVFAGRSHAFVAAINSSVRRARRTSMRWLHWLRHERRTSSWAYWGSTYAGIFAVMLTAGGYILLGLELWSAVTSAHATLLQQRGHVVHRTSGGRGGAAARRQAGRAADAPAARDQQSSRRLTAASISLTALRLMGSTGRRKRL